MTAAAGEDATWRKSVLRDYFESICIAVIFALFVRTFVVQAFKIPSSSMEDNLLVGDHILVNKFAYAAHPASLEGLFPYRAVEREDVVVFKFPRDPNRDFIKRVIATGGDTVRIDRGQVVRNGQALEEPYVFLKAPHARFAGGGPAPDPVAIARSRSLPEVRVPPGQYYVMGDNRLNSDDSRYWGTVPPSHVKGKALLIYWSFDVPEECKPVEVDGNASIPDKSRCLGYTMLRFLDKTRWGRTFRIIR